MQRIDEVKMFQDQQKEIDYFIAVVTMIEQQIKVIEGIMIRNQHLVKSPLNYNLAAGHLDQLKTFSAAAFTGHTPLAEEPKEIKPLYGDLK